MACYLRIFGDELDPDDCAKLFSVAPDSVWRRGERIGSTDRVRRDTRLLYLVSNHDWNAVQAQIEDALVFMRQHLDAVRAATLRSDVEVAFLDFGWEFSRSTMADSRRVPPELAALCGNAGIGIELSVYLHGPISDDDEDEEDDDDDEFEDVDDEEP